MRKYDGWCLKANGVPMPYWFRRTRTEGRKDWDAMSPSFPHLRLDRLRKRGTHKIVKVRIVEFWEPGKGPHKIDE